MSLIRAIRFTATWCGPCQQIKPNWLTFLKVNSDVECITVDIDEEDDEYQKMVLTYQIKSLPTLILITKDKTMCFKGSSDVINALKEYSFENFVKSEEF